MEQSSLPNSSALDEETDRLQRKLERQISENVALRRRIEVTEEQLELVLNSTTWRLTEPLRRALTRIKILLNYQSILLNYRSQRSRFYRKWTRQFASLTPELRSAMAARVATMASPPLISVIVPTLKINPTWIGETIESVRNQIYPNWELWIPDDVSTFIEIRPILERYRTADSRIRVHPCEMGEDVGVNFNIALNLATGDYIALLNANDLLSDDALFWVAHEIGMHPDVDLLFSDEDKIGANGLRFDPYFKSAWNPALMLSQNAFGHLGTYRRRLVEEVGRFREAYHDSQDYDLVLRCAAKSTVDRIRHIPRILYHKRTLQALKAARVKPCTWTAGQAAIIAHLSQIGVRAGVDRALENFYQVEYQMPQTAPMVSVLIPTTFSGETTARCLASVLTKSRYRNFEILLLAHSKHIRNAENNPKLVGLLADARVRVIRYEKEPFNYSWVNNLGAGSAHGDVLCFLNDDVEVITEDWLERLIARVKLEGVGAVGPMLYYPSNRIQHAGVILGIGGVAAHPFTGMKRGSADHFGRGGLEQDYSCVTAACMLMRRELFDRIEGFDESFPVAFNDVDLCIRIRQTGARIIWTPSVEMYHHESLTFGSHNAPRRAAQHRRDVITMRARWGGVLDADPCYNPNLSLVPGELFFLARPPRRPVTMEFSTELLAKSISRTSQSAFSQPEVFSLSSSNGKRPDTGRII